MLLHGGMTPIETFGGLRPGLSERFRVYLPERRGHGRTPDVPGPITYEIMAADTVAFLEKVLTEAAHLVGWSDGAVVGLLVALMRPDLVRSLVYVGNPLNASGLRPELQGVELSPDMLPPMLRELYGAVSPDGPEHFDEVFAKLIPTWQSEPVADLSELEQLPSAHARGCG